MWRRFANAAILLMALCCSMTSSAETLYLKNGQKINGKVVERKADSLIVELDGEERVLYWLDEVERVENNEGSPVLQEAVEDSSTRDSFAQEDGNPDGQLVLAYVQQSGALVKAVRHEITRNTLQLAGVLSQGDQTEGRRLERELTRKIRRYKGRLMTLSVPPRCQSFHAATLDWFQANEETHNALAEGDIPRSKIWAAEVFSRFDNMVKESKPLTDLQ